ncbi:hydratase/decarboxylase [Catenovulum agarivorans DS-2]|uniref:Hydratase/decarboxylase n=1 Tax=Catenovulum agarivorans DS-2 TaxID=1328313 RepID=W7QFS6_9ALTE|nr:hydratase [Catenovulum agarivorans]EWH10751.1 hydratase/decarboxylase [Catenovulum agarivorans DS-2]
MTTQIDTKQAAETLLNRRQPEQKFDALPIDIRPDNIDSALAVHKQMIELKQHKVAGWKCLLPPAEGKVVISPIFSDSYHTGAQACLMPEHTRARIEPEIAFVLAQDLPAKAGGYSEQEIQSVIASAHMALELMQARYKDDCDAQFYERLADCLTNQGLFVGPEIDKQTAFNTATIDIGVTQNGKTTAYEGKHPNKLAGNPLSWFVNFALENGFELKKGQAIITGSFAGVLELEFGQTEISYKGLGEYTVELVSK